MKKYTVVIHWSDEDAGYIATCCEFPGVSAFGESYEVAAREMDIALDAAIEACLRLGRNVPSISQTRSASTSFTGKKLVPA